MADDVHNYKRRLELILALIERAPNISDHNKRLILGFHMEMLANGLSAGRVVRKLYDLKTICIRWWLQSKNLDDAVTDDIKRVVVQIETSDYRESTKRDFKISLRSFYSWLRKHPMPEEVAWFKTAMKRHNEKLPEDLLTEEEVRKLIRHEVHARQRALIAFLYESGCRIGELLGIKLKHLSFDRLGAVVLVHGKTGSRRIRIIASVPYLAEWLNVHPQRDDPEAFIWVQLQRPGRLRYTAVVKMISETAARAGVKKKVNPHNFRHSRATALAQHLTEAQMKVYLGWVQASDMASVYVHLSGRDVDDAVLRLYGMETEKSHQETKMKPAVCSQCHEVNGFANHVCRRCGNPIQTAQRIVTEQVDRNVADNLLDRMLEDPGFKELFIQKARAVMNDKPFSV